MEFSKKASVLLDSPRENSLAGLSDPTLIKLSSGNPPDEGFPVEHIREISAKLLAEDPYSMLSYSVPAGREDLKEAVRGFLNRRFPTVYEGDTVTITTGGQQAISLTAQLFCNDGDVILCESPTFMAALDSLRAQGAKLVGVEMEEDGISLSDLEAKMQMSPKPKLLYIIPDFQNPSGISLPAYKREAVCELAYKYGVPVLEDNPYYELRFDGEFVPFLKCFDRHGMVALTSTMSKIVAPGMRVGYVVASGKMGEGLSLLKSTSDLHVSTWAQRVCCELLKSGMEDDIARLRELYGHRGRLMYQKLGEYCHPAVKYTKPQGGMFIWVTFPAGTDCRALVQELAENKVLVVPGGRFYCDGRQSTDIRLCYSMTDDGAIDKAISILGRLSNKYCK